MSDIFISYARSTEREAKAIAEALRELGYRVWRDDELPAHRAYADVIRERLAAAKAVLVIWSAEAVGSEWVRSEAERARADRKLVQLSLDGAELPMPFDQTQCADLKGWNGRSDHPGWAKVTASVAALVGGPTKPAKASAAPGQASICVLPFANVSDDPQQEYFSDGISEDIITDLSKVSALAVTARNTAFTFKGKAVDIPALARQLGVSHVLEGSVRKAGNRLRINAQLIDGGTGNHLWAERWDRTLDDIFALQDELSEAIVAALRVKLLPEERQAIEKRGTDNVEAYNFYLMARRYLLSQSGTRHFDLMIRLCQMAVDLDPAYSLAWSLMARAKAMRATSESAQADDDGWAEAERALALEPNMADGHATKAKLLQNRGQFAEAQAEIDTALRLDPRSNNVNQVAGYCALVGRRFPEAIRYFEAATEADAQDAGSPFMAMQCYLTLGDETGAKAAARHAVERLERAIAREPDNGSLLAFGVGALAVLGEVERAQDWAKQALILDPKDANLRYNLACAMIRLGEINRALQYLAETFELGGAALVHWARKDSDMDPLRGDARFEALMAKAEAGLAGRAASGRDE